MAAAFEPLHMHATLRIIKQYLDSRALGKVRGRNGRSFKVSIAYEAK